MAVSLIDAYKSEAALISQPSEDHWFQPWRVFGQESLSNQQSANTLISCISYDFCLSSHRSSSTAWLKYNTFLPFPSQNGLSGLSTARIRRYATQSKPKSRQLLSQQLSITTKRCTMEFFGGLRWVQCDVFRASLQFLNPVCIM